MTIQTHYEKSIVPVIAPPPEWNFSKFCALTKSFDSMCSAEANFKKKQSTPLWSVLDCNVADPGKENTTMLETYLSPQSIVDLRFLRKTCKIRDYIMRSCDDHKKDKLDEEDTELQDGLDESILSFLDLDNESYYVGKIRLYGSKLYCGWSTKHSILRCLTDFSQKRSVFGQKQRFFFLKSVPLPIITNE